MQYMVLGDLDEITDQTHGTHIADLAQPHAKAPPPCQTHPPSRQTEITTSRTYTFRVHLFGDKHIMRSMNPMATASITDAREQIAE